MMNIKLLALLAVGSSGLLSLGHANAAINWNMTGSPASSTAGTAMTSTQYTFNVGNTKTYDGSVASAPTVTAQAWANTGNGTCSGKECVSGNTNSDSYKIESAYLDTYSGSGLGVTNRDKSPSTSYGDYSEGGYPEHAVDNNQRNDMVLFNFGAAINLTHVILGWSLNCADITVLAYQGAAPLALDGLQYSNLDPSGWTVIGHYLNTSDPNHPEADITVDLQNTGANAVSSSYWLIGAYNPYVGGAGLANGCDGLTVTGTSGSTSCGGTYTPTSFNSANFKIAGLAGDTGPGPGPVPDSVPEPGTLGLLGLGLVGLIKTRRRFRQAA